MFGFEDAVWIWPLGQKRKAWGIHHSEKNVLNSTDFQGFIEFKNLEDSLDFKIFGIF